MGFAVLRRVMTNGGRKQKGTRGDAENDALPPVMDDLRLRGKWVIDPDKTNQVSVFLGQTDL